MVKIKNLYKKFGKQEVLKGINLELKKGKVTAILGPNGSGKTTLIKSILGLVIPTDGEIYVKGENVRDNWSYRKYIGYMPQIAVFPENLTLKELINMLLDIRKEGYNPNIKDDFIKHFKLEEYMDKKLKNLSGGTKQKVSALITFMFDPEIYFLDEPTVGLDPISSSFLKDKIREQAERDRLVVLTSHIMSEVEELADDIVFLLEGVIHVQGSVKEIIQSSGEKNLERAIAKLMEKKYNA
ncbi:Cu-processing system ATP-binding protein [Persephonella hydrogeniphila]|uniref:Cu-processing system ATP-binding protein n=1 Tax=Persephonella hydrogeniphila TaxID=198703 RepID=A0A285NLX6_9AQUI|nr:ABC transporter ATP-binding protein [Persephonella hydrogeniphila]SNZ08641.1 Cu-processing system ATP-binding protein [Persephonella hydrogeniphila]